MAETKSPVHAFAETRGISVLTPQTLKGEAERQAFAAHEADAAVVVAYGMLLPKAILDAPRHGCFNVHASLLPRWRGAAPIQRAIMAGDTETGVMVMRMEEGLDSGPVCATARVPISPDMTAAQLHDVLSAAGAPLMVEALANLERGTLPCKPQPAEGVCYAAKIDKAESRIDFTRPAKEVHNRIRGLSPFPGAWIEVAAKGGAPERLKVLRSAIADDGGEPGVVLDDMLTIACGAGAVRLLEVQRAGKRPSSAAEFLRGFDLPKGTKLR
jgi:methionyl-tRNA formyltransferase